MKVVILEKNKELAESLKRAISIKYSCSIEKSFSIEELERKYKGSTTTFIINESKNDEEGINEEGLKLAYLISDRINLNSVIFGLKKKEETLSFKYLKIPFQLKELYKAISTVSPIVKSIDEDILLEKYEHFRTKTSHDYIQYVTKNWSFYKYLLLNFSRYVKMIFGIDLKNKGSNENEIKEMVKKYENQRNYSILHNLLLDLKVEKLNNGELNKFPEMRKKFFKNLDFLIQVFEEKVKAHLNIEKKVAENFFLSWYMWRELSFLEKYNKYFSDGFFGGCFRSLLYFNSPHFSAIKKETLLTVLNCKSLTEANTYINKKKTQIEKLFK